MFWFAKSGLRQLAEMIGKFVQICLSVYIVCAISSGCVQSKSETDPNQLMERLELNDQAIEKLITNLTARVAKDPNDGDAWGELAIAYEANGFPETSLLCYNEAQTHDADDVRWFYLPAVLLSREGDLTEALALMSRALDVEKEYGPGYVWLGRWLLELNRLDEAMQAFRLARDSKVGPVAELGIAQVELNRGNPQIALDLLDSLPAEYSHPQVYRLRSNALRRLNRSAEANIAASFAEENVDVWWPDPILDDRKKFTVGFKAKLSVVEDLRKQGRMPDALLVLDELLLTNPDDASLLYQSGLVDYQLNDLEGATNHLRRAIEIDETHYPSRLLLAEIFRSQLRLSDSIEQLENVIAVHPTLSSPHEQLAKIYIHRGENGAALASIERAIELDAKEKEVFYYAGILEGSQGHWRKAIEYFEKAIRVEPTYHQAYAGLAQCYGELGELQAATQSLEQAHSFGLANEEYQNIKTWLENIES